MGSWGYENFLEAIRDGNHEEHEEYLEWIGDEFDPEEFDLDAINEELRNLKQRRTRDDDFWETEDQELDEEGAYDIVKWQESLSPEENDFAEKASAAAGYVGFADVPAKCEGNRDKGYWKLSLESCGRNLCQVCGTCCNGKERRG